MYDKCRYCKKAALQGYYRCELTNVMRRGACYQIHGLKCKDYKPSIWQSFLRWLGIDI